MNGLICGVLALLAFAFFLIVAILTTPKRKRNIVKIAKIGEIHNDKELIEDNEEQSEADGLMTMDDPLFPPDFEDESEE
jgi:hypothetical protein